MQYVRRMILIAVLRGLIPHIPSLLVESRNSLSVLALVAHALDVTFIALNAEFIEARANVGIMEDSQ